MKFYLLFARGQANPNTLNTYPHSILDGPLFPFISSEIVSFCETGCGQAEGMPWITQTHQVGIFDRIWDSLLVRPKFLKLFGRKYQFSTSLSCCQPHSSSFQRRSCLLGSTRAIRWGVVEFICGSMWVELLGLPVFDSFQIHWICNFLGVASTSVAFFSIYYEAYFKVLQCSSECGDVVRWFLHDSNEHFQSFNRRSHAIYGTVAYSLILFQALMGMCRPTITSVFRPRFNLVHTFMGYSIWLLCCKSPNNLKKNAEMPIILMRRKLRWKLHSRCQT